MSLTSLVASGVLLYFLNFTIYNFPIVLSLSVGIIIAPFVYYNILRVFFKCGIWHKNSLFISQLKSLIKWYIDCSFPGLPKDFVENMIDVCIGILSRKAEDQVVQPPVSQTIGDVLSSSISNLQSTLSLVSNPSRLVPEQNPEVKPISPPQSPPSIRNPVRCVNICNDLQEQKPLQDITPTERHEELKEKFNRARDKYDQYDQWLNNHNAMSPLNPVELAKNQLLKAEWQRAKKELEEFEKIIS